MRSGFLSFTVVALAIASPAFSGAVVGGFNASSLAANDDSSTLAIGLGFSVDFFGASTSTVYVNNNGNVTFTNPLSTYTPNGLASGVGQPIIAPFFGDVDTRTGNLVTYGTGTYNGHNAFGVEWPAVGYFFEHTDKVNTFELILTDRSDTGAGNFDIEFNYDTIAWETGDASSGSGGLGGTSAVAGYSNGLSGASNVFYQLPGSLVNGALLDGGANALISNQLNSNLDGRYDFQVRGGAVVSPVPEPNSVWLGLSGLVALGLIRRRKLS